MEDFVFSCKKSPSIVLGQRYFVVGVIDHTLILNNLNVSMSFHIVYGVSYCLHLSLDVLLLYNFNWSAIVTVFNYINAIYTIT